MTKLNLTFQKAGLLTSLQDQGRLGHQDKGVPVGGVMDRQAAKAANLLVGNAATEAVIEVTMLGPTIHFDAAVTIAITGADFPLKLNGEPISTYKKVQVPADSLLQFGSVKRGCRAYLAIAAAWPFERWLGSLSPVSMASDLLQGHIMKKGELLTFDLTTDTAAEAVLSELKISPENLSPFKRVRVTIGPEFHYLSKASVAKFFGQGHKISQEASRMGYKLASSISQEANAAEMISSGILPGTIQLTSGGQPIILLADAQTTGGYPRIARVIDEDLDALAQLKPGDEVWFSLA